MRERIFKLVSIATIVFFLTVWVVVFLGVSNNKVIQEPSKREPAAEQIDVKIKSKNAIAVDLLSGKPVYQKKAKEKARPASLTKMMTALVVIENNRDLNKKIRVPKRICNELKGRDIAVAGFKGGERVTARDLLYGILFESGAECCMTMAEETAGSEKEFVKMMNKKAKAIGMKHTTFGNSVGLDYPDCYTTASDMAILVRYALKNEMFRKVYTSETYVIKPTNKRKKSRTIENRTVTMFGDERAGVFGGKRGYTPKANLCLSTVAKINGREYICVSFGAPMTEKSSGAHVKDTRKIYRAIEKL